MTGISYTMKSKVWIYPSMASWHFLNIGKEESKEIKLNASPFKKGFGSVPVRVTINNTTWDTSIFPDKTGIYLLPVKKAVRVIENISAKDIVEFSIEIREM